MVGLSILNGQKSQHGIEFDRFDDLHNNCKITSYILSSISAPERLPHAGNLSN